MYIFILKPTFSRVLNSIKSMDSMDSLYIIEMTSVLYPLLCLLTSESYGTCTLGGGTGHREIWYVQSKFDIVMAGLKWCQGKPIGNSISFKVGEELFKEQVML